MCALSVFHKSITIPPLCGSQMKSCPLFLHLSVRHSFSFLPPIILSVCCCWLQGYVKFMHVDWTPGNKDQRTHSHTWPCEPSTAHIWMHLPPKTVGWKKTLLPLSIHSSACSALTPVVIRRSETALTLAWPVLVDMLTMEAFDWWLGRAQESFLGFVWAITWRKPNIPCSSPIRILHLVLLVKLGVWAEGGLSFSWPLFFLVTLRFHFSSRLFPPFFMSSSWAWPRPQHTLPLCNSVFFVFFPPRFCPTDSSALAGHSCVVRCWRGPLPYMTWLKRDQATCWLVDRADVTDPCGNKTLFAI